VTAETPDPAALPAAAAREIVVVGRFLHGRGWSPATSSNYSVRLDAERAAITVSGRDKGDLAEDDVMVVDLEGRALSPGKRPSAETLLHTRLYARDPAIGAVLHVHPVHATVASRLAGDALVWRGYELQKAFAGVATHESETAVPVFENSQDMAALADAVDAWLDAHPPPPGYLIRAHGLYAWGRDMAEARRHVEAIAFLCECHLLEARTRP